MITGFSEENFRSILITGASSGFGEAFARALAGNGRRLLLVARRQERLIQLAEELNAASPLGRVDILVTDLTQPADREAVIAAAQAAEVDLLINNAGCGDYGAFDTSDWIKSEALLQLNMVALTHLAHGVIPMMKARNGGGMINISSLASELFMPDFAIYAASKAYVSRFSEALRLENRSHGLKILAVCPGPVRTEFGHNARREGEKKKDTPLYGWLYTTPQRIAAESLQALVADKALLYPSWPVRLMAHGVRLLPRPLVRWLMSRRPRRSQSAASP